MDIRHQKKVRLTDKREKTVTAETTQKTEDGRLKTPDIRQKTPEQKTEHDRQKTPEAGLQTSKQKTEHRR